jgi:hypothetical protein
MRHNVVSREITGRGYRYPNVPAQMMEDSAPSVRYETKKRNQEMSCAASCGAIRMVRRQESAEAIVAQRREQCPGHGEGPNIKKRKRSP